MSNSNPDQNLSERAQQLLKTLIQRYIQDGQPVGSKTLAQATGLELSPATIRNIMADLEERGLVHSPHTSAGRIPTVCGYRMFVDSMITSGPLDIKEMNGLRQQFDTTTDPQGLVTNTSDFLSAVTSMAGVVTLPRHRRVKLRQLEFLPLSEQRVLVILVTDTGEVQNRVVRLHRQFTAVELQEIANYLNQHFAGKEMNQVRQDLMRELEKTRVDMDQTMRVAIEMAGKVFEMPETDEDMVVKGQINLMDFEELSSINKLRQLFEAFNRKQEILHVLDQCIHASGVQIFIGEESGYQVLDNCSIVTAPYSQDGQVLGVLGVIGPTRMDYKRVISIVDITAKLLGAALNSR